MRLVANLFLLFIIIVFTGCGSTKEIADSKSLSLLNLSELFKEDFNETNLGLSFKYKSKVDSIIVDDFSNEIEIHFNKSISYNPIREETLEQLEKITEEYFQRKLEIKYFVYGYPFEDLIPNFYRKNLPHDIQRKPLPNYNRPKQVVRNISKPYQVLNGLHDLNIALWHSHGWYYSKSTNRWEWQRPRLFQTVEDQIPMQFTIPYLIPMLENAGANVYVPRERDIQTNEVIVDNDSAITEYGSIEFDENIWLQDSTGFAIGNPPYELNYNPFKHGTSLFSLTDEIQNSTIKYIPNIPEDGDYAVYISYTSKDENTDDAHYTVYHLGGKTEFEVNQQIGGSSWYYLGTFKFAKGQNPELGSVTLSNNSSNSNRIVSADAVRFGGGIGVVKRDGATSGRPKYLEGSKYYLQFAGMPDTLVYNFNDNENDYSDDYQSRGEYVNYLMGTPNGPFINREVKGLGIPIDLAFSFHTDAGITKDSSTIGTLGIYSILDKNKSNTFPTGVSRLSNRDLTDIIQTQIVEDIRSIYNPTWNRRQLYNAMYHEAYSPNAPVMLLELLSHQNLADMQHMLDPRFRFHVSRSMYKGMLKFLSVQNDFEYVVQPLPVTHFSTEVIDDKVKLSWQPKEDELDTTAVPTSYIVYTRVGNKGFDNGKFTEKTELTLPLVKDSIYSFKVTAVNKGGESFPSEILSACIKSNSRGTVLVVNGFDRICGPQGFRTNIISGFNSMYDNGVPDKRDIGFTGFQYDYLTNSQFVTNDAPGHGASYADYETKIIAGNTFDYPFIHGQSISQVGYSFTSCSDEVIEDSLISLKDYNLVDLIMGEEKTTESLHKFTVTKDIYSFKTFSKELKKQIKNYLSVGGNIFLSGSHIGTDQYINYSSEDDREFIEEVLKFKLATDHASKLGKVFSTSDLFNQNEFDFCTNLNEKIYCVEAPDAINPVNGSETIFRYKDNSFSAGTAYNKEYGVVAIGFPFETILNKEDRDRIMKEIIEYFNR